MRAWAPFQRLGASALAENLVFIEALARGMVRYLRFLAADRLDTSGVRSEGIAGRLAEVR